MQFWGKLHQVTDGCCLALPLSHHCIDVASVFRALCDLPATRRMLAKTLPTGTAADDLSLVSTAYAGIDPHRPASQPGAD